MKMYYNDIVVFEKFPDENVHDSMALCAWKVASSTVVLGKLPD
jgi:hypothetical protein